MPRSAIETVRAYAIEAWSNGRDDLIPELCHDPMIRHDPGSTIALNHAEQRARMRHNYDALRPRFREVVLRGDDEHVTLVWDVTGRDPDWRWCGIEVFRVVEGRIAEVWNSAYADGSWSAARALVGQIGTGEPCALPLVRSELRADDGRVDGCLVAPAEVRGLSWWLRCLLGKPHGERMGERTRLRFSPGDQRETPKLFLIEDERTARPLRDPAIADVTLQRERSGLVNAAIALSAREGEGEAAPASRASGPVTRLAQTVGSFQSSDREGQVIEAAITLLGDGSAHGRVTLRADGAAIAEGSGKLAFGWHEGERSVRFEGTATLTEPSGEFVDAGVAQASYAWRSERIVATIEGPPSELSALEP